MTAVWKEESEGGEEEREKGAFFFYSRGWKEETIFTLTFNLNKLSLDLEPGPQ